MISIDQEDRITYDDGQEVRLGDQIRLGDAVGEVVCLPKERECGPGYGELECSFLKTGVMIKTDLYGPIHYPDKPEQDIELVRRAQG